MSWGKCAFKCDIDASYKKVLTLWFPLAGIFSRETKLGINSYSKYRTAAYLHNVKKCKNMVTGWWTPLQYPVLATNVFWQTLNLFQKGTSGQLKDLPQILSLTNDMPKSLSSSAIQDQQESFRDAMLHWFTTIQKCFLKALWHGERKKEKHHNKL